MPKHFPKRYRDSSVTPTDQERRVAVRTGGKRVSGSGASMYSKGDVRDVPARAGDNDMTFLTECKQTIHESISVKWDWLVKITKEADAVHSEPALAIEMKGGKPDPMTDRDWVLIPLRVFNKLKSGD